MEICPQEAKTFDSDLAYVKSLLYKKERVVVSLDPSYRGLLDDEALRSDSWWMHG